MSNNDNILPRTPGATEACLQAMSTGIATWIQPTDQVMLNGVQYVKTDLQTKVDTSLGTFTKVGDAEATFHSLVGQRTKAEPDTAEMISYFLIYLQNRYGVKSPMLDKFGFRPRKTGTALTVEQKAAKAANDGQAPEEGA